MHCFYSYFEWVDMKETYYYMIRKASFEHKKEYKIYVEGKGFIRAHSSSRDLHRKSRKSITGMVTTTTTTMCNTFCKHLGANVYNVLDSFAIFLGFLIVLLITMRMVFDKTIEDFPLGKPPGSIRRIEDATRVQYYVFFSLYNGVWWIIFVIGWQTFIITISYLKKLAWHPGASIFARTIEHAFHDLTDTAAIMLLLFLGFGMTSGMWFGAIGGDLAFKSFLDSTNTVSRLSFGLIDYTDFMSWGHGKKYDGIGIGNAAWTKVIVFWILFVLLNIIMLNLLIAVVSEGFNKYKETVKKRPHENTVLFSYIFKRALFFIFHGKLGIYESPTYQELKKNLGLYPGPGNKRNESKLKNTQITWVHRMDLASSKFGKALASACLNPAAITPTANWIEDFAVRIKGAFEEPPVLYDDHEEHLIDERTCRRVLSKITNRTDLFLLVVVLLSQNFDVADEEKALNKFKEYFKKPSEEIKEMVKCYRNNVDKKDGTYKSLVDDHEELMKKLTNFDVTFICDHVELIWEIYKEEYSPGQDNVIGEQ